MNHMEKIHLLKKFRNNKKTHQRILILSTMRNLRFIFLMTQEKRFILKTSKGYFEEEKKEKKKKSGGYLLIQ